MSLKQKYFFQQGQKNVVVNTWNKKKLQWKIFKNVKPDSIPSTQ